MRRISKLRTRTRRVYGRKYHDGWDRRVIAAALRPGEHAHTALIRTIRRRRQGTTGRVGYGRSSIARTTASRTFISSRLTVGAGRWGVRGRIRLRGHDEHEQADEHVPRGDRLGIHPARDVLASPAEGTHTW